MNPPLQIVTSRQGAHQVAGLNDRSHVSRVRALMGPRAGVRLALMFAIASCHGGDTGPRDITVTLAACSLGATQAAKTCPATSLLPLQLVEVRAVATPLESFSIDRVVITAEGVITQADTFVPQSAAAGAAIAVDTFFVPSVFGTVTFTAKASGGSAS